MAKEDTQKKDTGIEIIPEEQVKDPAPDQLPPNAYDMGQYIVFLNAMKYTKKHITSAPTKTPNNFYDSIQFYDTGGVRRLYLFVNGTWRYVVLT